MNYIDIAEALDDHYFFGPSGWPLAFAIIDDPLGYHLADARQAHQLLSSARLRLTQGSLFVGQLAGDATVSVFAGSWLRAQQVNVKARTNDVTRNLMRKSSGDKTVNWWSSRKGRKSYRCA